MEDRMVSTQLELEMTEEKLRKTVDELQKVEDCLEELDRTRGEPEKEGENPSP
jgi:hypothetical protein